ncbi:hypothetical protein [Catenulispora pinisilvae]|uniref:hypothetical protein n=1 Tax=Catenulispora pinisilvae TaxID=2705253 RepID=UPI001891316B|nr:hypothetical protein [Catenulispora pinisilvae]
MADFTGQIASFDANQGYGFITPAPGTIVPDPVGETQDELDDNVFVSAAQIRDATTPAPFEHISWGTPSHCDRSTLLRGQSTRATGFSEYDRTRDA